MTDWRLCSHSKFNVESMDNMSCDEYICTVMINCLDCENNGYFLFDSFENVQEYHWHSDECMAEFEVSYDPAQQYCRCGIE